MAGILAHQLLWKQLMLAVAFQSLYLLILKDEIFSDYRLFLALVRPNHAPEVHLKADVLRLLVGPDPVRLAELSNTMGVPSSVKAANSYRAPDGMFRVDHIHAN